MSQSTHSQFDDKNVRTVTSGRVSMPSRCSLVEPVPDSPLITEHGVISRQLQQFLLSLPRPARETADVLTEETFEKIEQGTITLRELNHYLQEAVFKKNADRFSYELTGVQPTPEQCALLEQLGFMGEARVAPGVEFDTAVVWGGTLAAVESRILFYWIRE